MEDAADKQAGSVPTGAPPGSPRASPQLKKQLGAKQAGPKLLPRSTSSAKRRDGGLGLGRPRGDALSSLADPSPLPSPSSPRTSPLPSGSGEVTGRRRLRNRGLCEPQLRQRGRRGRFSRARPGPPLPYLSPCPGGGNPRRAPQSASRAPAASAQRLAGKEGRSCPAQRSRGLPAPRLEGALHVLRGAPPLFLREGWEGSLEAKMRLAPISVRVLRLSPKARRSLLSTQLPRAALSPLPAPPPSHLRPTSREGAP